MTNLKRLLFWVFLSSIPTLITIMVWLVTFRGFPLLVVLKDTAFICTTLIFSIVGFLVSASLDKEQIDDIIS